MGSDIFRTLPSIFPNKVAPGSFYFTLMVSSAIRHLSCLLSFYSIHYTYSCLLIITTWYNHQHKSVTQYITFLCFLFHFCLQVFYESTFLLITWLLDHSTLLLKHWFFEFLFCMSSATSRNQIMTVQWKSIHFGFNDVKYKQTKQVKGINSYGNLSIKLLTSGSGHGKRKEEVISYMYLERIWNKFDVIFIQVD